MTNDKGGMHIVYLYADSEMEWNCSHWRCHLLSNAINAAHEANPKAFPATASMYLLQSALQLDHPRVQSQLGVADIIVFQRNVIVEEVWNAMDYWRALGKTVVVDLDDHYPNIPASNPAFNYWIANVLAMDPNPVARLTEGLKRADALISPSNVILNDWKDVVPGYWWPNYPSLKDYEAIKPKRGGPDMVFDYDVSDPKKPKLIGKPREDSENKIFIGWGGSISHVDSFVYSGVVEGLRMVLEELPNVYFKFCGHEARLNYLFDKLPKDKMVRQIGVLPRDWPQVVSSFDIGLAPLDLREADDNTGGGNTSFSYDERRSWLKLVEYISAGVPFVATDAAPYRPLKRFGKLVANTPQAWYEALKTVAQGLTWFREDADKTRAEALKKYTIENNARGLVDLYEKIAVETQVRRQSAKLPAVIYV